MYDFMTSDMLAMFGLPGGGEWIIVLIIAIILFGRRLPGVAGSIGKSIVEFKRGLKDVHYEIEEKASQPRLGDNSADDKSESDKSAVEPSKEAAGKSNLDVSE